MLYFPEICLKKGLRCFQKLYKYTSQYDTTKHTKNLRTRTVCESQFSPHREGVADDSALNCTLRSQGELHKGALGL